MNWATPGLAALAGAVAVPTLLILYFLKLRRRNVEISSTLLWKKAIQDLQANAPFQRLRRNLLLFLQLLVLGAVLLAIAQPQMMSDHATGELKIFMIDRSASMASMDGDTTGGTRLSRLDQAKRLAIREVEAMREAGLFKGEEPDQGMVIAFDGTAVVVQQFTSDKEMLKAAIRSIEQTDGPSRLDEAMSLAKSRKPPRVLTDTRVGEDGEVVENISIEGLTSGPPQLIHLYTDGQLVDSARVLPDQGDTVLFHAIGTSDAVNLGLTSVRAERSYQQPEQLTVFAAIENTASTAREVDVELRVDGTPVATRRVTIPGSASQGASVTADGTGSARAARPASGAGGIAFPLTLARGALVEVRLIGDGDDDVLDRDDRAWLIVPPAEQTAVAVVSADDIFLLEALSGLRLSRLSRYTPSEFTAMLADGRAAEYDVVLLDRWLPTIGNETLPRGRWIVLGAVPGGVDGLVDGGVGGVTTILDWRTEHPALRPVTLDPLVIGRFRRVSLPETSNALVLADAAEGPAIVELSGVEFRALVVPWEIEQSNWPFQVGFVLFLASGIDYLSASRASEAEAGGASRLFRPGDILADRLPLDAREVDVTLMPGGRPMTTTPTGDGRITHGPLTSIGVYRVRWSGSSGATDVREDGRVSRFYAANLASPEETDVRTAESLFLASQTLAATDSERQTEVRRLWPYLVLIGLGIIILEWFIYNRKVYV